MRRCWLNHGQVWAVMRVGTVLASGSQCEPIVDGAVVLVTRLRHSAATAARSYQIGQTPLGCRIRCKATTDFL